MQNAVLDRLTTHGPRLGRLGLGGIALMVFLTACGEDAIVYPNRNLRPPSGGETGDSGAAGQTGDAGEAGTNHGGAPQGGSGGAKGGSGGLGGKGGSAGTAGAVMVGPVCGDKKVEAPEQCDDGNTVSGDGCSWDCKSACEICEQKVCPLYETDEIPETSYDSCYTGTGKISKGPATGVLRSEVCQQLVDCIRQESCAQVRNGVLRTQRCWCDLDWNPPKSPYTECKTEPDPLNPQDPTRFIPGKCASLFQDASENGRLADVAPAFTATDLAEGRAIRLLSQCDTRICTEECVAGYFTAAGIATISADIVLAANSAGESPLGNLVADSQRVVAGADFALVSPTFVAAFLGDPLDLLVAPTPNRNADAPGRVLWSEALAVSFGYRSMDGKTGLSTNPQASLDIYKVSFTGDQIYQALTQQFSPSAGGLLFVSGLTYSYILDASNPAASSIGEVRKASDGTVLDRSSSYTVALSAFLTNAQSPIPVLKLGSNASVLTGVFAAELLGEYMKGLPQPVAPPELNRIKRLN